MKEWKTTAWMFGISIVVFLLFVIMDLPVQTRHYVAVGWIVLILMLLWAGNRLISAGLQNRFPWERYASKRFFIQLSVSSAYSLLCINLTYVLFRWLFTKSLPDSTQMVVMNFYGIFFFIPIISVNFGIFFMRAWRRMLRRTDKAFTDSTERQIPGFQAARTKPDFLIRTFKILDSHISRNPEEARELLHKLSEVLAYTTEQQQNSSVALSEEIRFVYAYAHLLRHHHPKQLKVSVTVTEDTSRFLLPPFCLQHLLEKAVNDSSLNETETSLDVEIMITSDDFLMVKHNLESDDYEDQSDEECEKEFDILRKRFDKEKGRKPEFIRTRDFFVAKMPLRKAEGMEV